MCCSIIGENEKTLTALIFGSDSCPGRVPICGLPLVAGGWHDATLRTSLTFALPRLLAGRMGAGRVPFCVFVELSLSFWFVCVELSMHHIHQSIIGMAWDTLGYRQEDTETILVKSIKCRAMLSFSP